MFYVILEGLIFKRSLYKMSWKGHCVNFLKQPELSI